jgi:hypothetical protein
MVWDLRIYPLAPSSSLSGDALGIIYANTPCVVVFVICEWIDCLET